MRSSEFAVSLEEVIVEMPQYKQLSTLAASWPLTSPATCASETSALNFMALFTDGVMELHCFVLYDNALSVCVTGSDLD